MVSIVKAMYNHIADLYLEILPQDIAHQAASMLADGMDVAALVDRRGTRFTARVHFLNRNGYRRR